MVTSEKRIPVRLTIETTITDRPEEEQSSVVAMGTLFVKKKAVFLIYEEKNDGRQVRHTIKVDEHRVTIVRGGAVSTRQQFIPATETESVYETPYGALPMRTKAETCQYEWNDARQKGALLLTYKLWIQGSYTGFYTVKITMEGVET